MSGPSFLGLADDEPTDRIAYLLEDEPGGSHGARLFVIVVLLVGIAFAGWHWRWTLRGWAMQAMQRPTNSQGQQQSQETSYKSTPISTGGSEVAGSVPNATTITPTQPAPAATQNQAASPQNAQNQTPNETPAAPAPAAQSAPNPTASTQANQSQDSGRGATSSAPAESGPSQANLPPQVQPAQTSGPAGTTAMPQSSPQAASQPQVPASSAAGPAEAKSAPPVNEQGTASSSARSDQPASAKKSASPSKAPQAQSQAPETPDQGLEAEGEKYLYGTGVPANCERAQKDLLAAGEHANPKAASVLGTMYATGHCVTRDLPLAYFWFAKAMREDPNNARAENDLLMVWSQMTAQERELAVQRK